MPDTAPALTALSPQQQARQVERQTVRAEKLPVTFVVLTKNEECNLSGCLDSILHLSDDIHVLDSGSTDATLTIAEWYGVPSYFHPFYGFGDQRNWAIDNIPHRYDWTFHLDADERMTDELAWEIHSRLDESRDESGFFVPSKLMFCGQWLRRAGSYPTYQVRLFHRQRLRFIDQGHGQREVTEGRVGYLTQPYIHEAFSKGLEEWLAKHSGYALHEAEHYLAHPGGGLISDIESLFSQDRIARRRAMKRLSFKLPFRSMLRFLDIVLIKRGFLDGRAGLAYARMLAAYEAMIAAHLAVLRCYARWDKMPGASLPSEWSSPQTSPVRRPR